MPKNKKSDKALKEKIKKSDKERSGGMFYLAEQKIIKKILPKIPRFLTPDRLTLISIIAYILAGLFFYLSTFNKFWLIGVIVSLALNWFGDSFDGAIARFRNIQRPRYGYYVDHILDAFGPVFFLVGLGLSPLMHMSIALGLAICYLVLAVSTYLTVYTQGKYSIGYSGLGGTEARIVISIFCFISLFFVYPMNLFHLWGTTFTVWDIAGVAALIVFSYMLVACVVNNLVYLNKIDKKTYKELSLQEAFEKSSVLNNFRKSDVGKILSGEHLEKSLKNLQNEINKR
jgi:archaetidylinositol phosphate synthase